MRSLEASISIFGSAWSYDFLGFIRIETVY